MDRSAFETSKSMRNSIIGSPVLTYNFPVETDPFSIVVLSQLWQLKGSSQNIIVKMKAEKNQWILDNFCNLKLVCTSKMGLHVLTYDARVEKTDTSSQVVTKKMRKSK